MRKFFLILLKCILCCFALSIGIVLLYRYVPVRHTPLMAIRHYEAHKEGTPYHIEHQWIPIEDMSPEIVRAVMASEDNLFLSHNGFSERGIRQAIREKKETGKVRHGGSTISQQTAKNIFCTNRRNFVRKGFEAYFTVLIEALWGKQRIMEVYLNSIEMGDGIYGIEAASRAYFRHGAASLSRQEAAQIAVCLPNPRCMFPDHPSAYVLKRRAAIVTLMPKLGKIPSPLPDDTLIPLPDSHTMGIVMLVYLLIINLVAFFLYGADKLKAQKQKWRIPEATLIWFAALGGSVGALIGMRVWHHKTLHKKFLIGVPAILVLQLALTLYFVL